MMVNGVLLIYLIIIIITITTLTMTVILGALGTSPEDDNELLSHANGEALCESAPLALLPIGKLNRARLAQLAL